MKKMFLAALVAAALGMSAGFAFGIFIYPFWFLRDVAMETVADAKNKTLLAKGAFVHVNPADPVHWGTGGVELLKDRQGERLVHLGEDFEVGPGPRFHVYLVDKPQVASAADFRAGNPVDLGRLRAFKGSQVYAIPETIDVSGIGSVVIWCKEFNVLISPASLKSPAVAAR